MAGVRKAQKAATRETILAVAASRFRTHGYEKATVRDIAQAAGLSTGAIFAQFTGKEDLYRAVYGHAPVSPETGAGLLNLVRRHLAGEGAVDAEMAKALVAQAMEA